ncbi:hypothetical protein QR685DRAFT_565245, partial [Neurospora intermedia]
DCPGFIQSIYRPSHHHCHAGYHHPPRSHRSHLFQPRDTSGECVIFVAVVIRVIAEKAPHHNHSPGQYRTASYHLLISAFLIFVSHPSLSLWVR